MLKSSQKSNERIKSVNEYYDIYMTYCLMHILTVYNHDKWESNVIHTEQQNQAKAPCVSWSAVMHHYHCSVFLQLSAPAAADSPCLLSTKFVQQLHYCHGTVSQTRNSADAEGQRNVPQIWNIAPQKACNSEWPSSTLKVITIVDIRQAIYKGHFLSVPVVTTSLSNTISNIFCFVMLANDSCLVVSCVFFFCLVIYYVIFPFYYMYLIYAFLVHN